MFGLDVAVNGLADWVCTAPIVGTVIKNPILTALMITAMVVIVIIAQARSSINRRKIARMSVYLVILVSATIFIHDFATVRAARSIGDQDSIRDVFAGIGSHAHAATPDHVPVWVREKNNALSTNASPMVNTGLPIEIKAGGEVAGGTEMCRYSRTDNVGEIGDSGAAEKLGLTDITAHIRRA